MKKPPYRLLDFCFFGWFFIVSMLDTGLLFGQVPSPERGKEIARMETPGGLVRLIQEPVTPLVHVPIRFYVLFPEGKNLDLFDLEYAEIRPASGGFAERVFIPKKYSINSWGSNMGEFRETFDMHGEYEIRVYKRFEREPLLATGTLINPVYKLDFMTEMVLFLSGCLILGFLLFLLWKHLHRQEASRTQIYTSGKLP